VGANDCKCKGTNGLTCLPKHEYLKATKGLTTPTSKMNCGNGDVCRTVGLQLQLHLNCIGTAIWQLQSVCLKPKLVTACNLSYDECFNFHPSPKWVRRIWLPTEKSPRKKKIDTKKCDPRKIAWKFIYLVLNYCISKYSIHSRLNISPCVVFFLLTIDFTLFYYKFILF
jgi:hypothetical protein